MQGSLDGDNSAGARKALAKVQKMLQLVSAKRHALALRDYRETLDECLKPEANATMKILAYRMAARVPTCTTHDVWQLLLDASVTELASSQNAPVLLHSIPILEQIPLPLVIGFLISNEKDPMNKLRAVLQHEQSDVRCCAIASLARVTLDAAVAIANDGLFAFPFDSHESRIVCQQDLWTIIADVWKIIFQSLSLEHAGNEQPQDADVAGASFAALRMLFARTAAMAPFHILQAQAATAHAHQRTAAYSAANDLAAAMYKEAFPRVRVLVQCAQRLPMKYQVDAAWWLAMLLSMMMDRSGAKCPGLSVACLEIDVVRSNPQDDDDDESRATTERVRVDYLASGVLEAWLLPLAGRTIPLAQSVALCRALFILLSHPLLTFTRLRTASTLVQQLIAQCYFHKVTDVKLEMSHLLVRAFAWVSSSECLVVFPRVVEAVHLMERETDRHDLLQLLLEGVCHRVVSSRDFLLLESIAALEIFRQPSGTSKLSPRTSGSHVYRALVHALLPRERDPQTPMELQVAQLIVLKAFIQVLLYKTNASVFTHPQHDDETQDVVCYLALLSDHFQTMLRTPSLTLKESLHFYQHDIQRAWTQISSCAVRLQLIWTSIQLQKRHQLLPTAKLLERVSHEISQSFSSSDTQREFSVEALAASSSSAVFDDGKLGGGSIHGAIYGDTHHGSTPHEEHSAAVVMAVSEILKALCDVGDRHVLQDMQASVRSYFAIHVPSSMLQTHLLEEPLDDHASALANVYVFEVFEPERVLQPHRHQPQLQPQSVSSLSALASAEGTRPPLLVTGSADPLTLHVTYQQTVAGHEDAITLCVSCCNTSTLPLSDFEIHIRPRGPVRCIDPSNDLKIRVQQGGGSTSSSLPPYATLKAEKRFLVQRFAEATFYFQVVYYVTDGDESVPIRIAPSSAFTVHFDALFRRPADALVSRPAVFQQVWRAAEDSTSFDIESTHDPTRSLSRGQVLVNQASDRVAIVAGLFVDLPTHTQICLLTKTRWDDLIAFSLTLTAATASGTLWTGCCEVRSSKPVVDEMARQPRDVLAILCGSQARVVTASVEKALLDGASAGSRTNSRVSSRTVSYTATTVVDPFAGDAAFPTATDLTSVLDPGATKWDTSGGGGFTTDQVRPTEPPFGDFGSPSMPSSQNAHPWGF